MIYLDNAATTAVDPRVLESMLPYLQDQYGNPSASNPSGERAQDAITTAKTQVAKLINASTDEIFFTSGATESNNWVAHLFKLLCDRYKVIYSPTSHPSVTESMRGIGIPVMSATGNLCISVESINNETGQYHDITALKERAGRRGDDYIIHADATQEACMHRIDATAADAVSFSGHKIHGPKGVGVLYINSQSPLYDLAAGHPFICGGKQQNNFRSGTENVPGIVGMGKACELAREYLEDDNRFALMEQFREDMLRIPDVRLTVSSGSPHITSLIVEGVRGDELMYLLQERGVIISTGSACHNNKAARSHVLQSIGLSDDEIDSTIRISFSRMTTPDEAVKAAEIIKNAIEDLKWK